MNAYKRGKKKVKNALIGAVMKEGGGNLNPKIVNETLTELLKEIKL